MTRAHRIWLSGYQLEASIGLAAKNYLIEPNNEHLVEINASELISRENKGRNLAVVGHFPFIDRIKAEMRNCWVIEKIPYGHDIPEEKAADYIPRTDVVVITATTLINKAFDGLPALCAPKSLVMLLGPSTPLPPSCLTTASPSSQVLALLMRMPPCSPLSKAQVSPR
jgi:uncharacterized protein